MIGAAGDLDELLARCPGVVILATSRTVLGLRAEREYPVPPLPLPADAPPTGAAGVPLAELAASPAVALFVDRARAVRPGFALTEGNAAAVAEICRRLEGLPLAIELAAARTRLLDPDALLDRLATSLDALGTGAVDLPERQRTLRATVEWSVGLLDDAERSLLEIVAVFVGRLDHRGRRPGGRPGRGPGAGADRGAGPAQPDLPRPHRATAPGCGCWRPSARSSPSGWRPGPTPPRSRAATPTTTGRWPSRPTGRCAAPASASGAERLEAEAGNLAAAVRWYLAHDTGPLPHLFRVLWLFWFLRDHLGEARAWVEQLLPTAGSLDPQARAELLWTAAATGRRGGRRPGGAGGPRAPGAAARRDRGPLPPRGVPAGHGVDLGDRRRLRRRPAGGVGLAWSSSAARTSRSGRRWPPTPPASWRSTVGRYDDALRHLTEVRDLAERFDNPWLAAVSRVYLGTLAVAQGRPEEARALLDEALELSLAAHSTRSVTLCLAAFARLALVEGDPERAALLAGAAEGLRRRVGLRAWPLLRREEAELVAQVRQALGADRFDQVFAAGSRLTQQEAVAAVRDRRGAGTAAP